MLRLALPILLLLTACAPSPQEDVAVGRAPPGPPLPPVKSFAVQKGAPVVRPNSEVAQDFLDLSFQMESGRVLPILTKFEGPIRVSVRGTPPPSLEADLARLLARLRSEAGIDIARAARGERGQIVIEAVPRKALQRAVPQAACFVVPNVAGWQDFRRNRRGATTDWTKLDTRRRATVIIPRDVSPQEVRDCLHEEIAQALGPLNDLYRLPDSTFNDDNFHTVLTGFDMLILRTYYAPELPNGISRANRRRGASGPARPAQPARGQPRRAAPFAHPAPHGAMPSRWPCPRAFRTAAARGPRHGPFRSRPGRAGRTTGWRSRSSCRAASASVSRPRSRSPRS